MKSATYEVQPNKKHRTIVSLGSNIVILWHQQNKTINHALDGWYFEFITIIITLLLTLIRLLSVKLPPLLLTEEKVMSVFSSPKF